MSYELYAVRIFSFQWEASLAFYRDVLGLEILREDEYRAGQVGFASVRITPETIIDVRPYSSDQEFVKNVDHICVRISPTDMEQTKEQLRARATDTDDDINVRWGAQGYGESLYIRDPEGQMIELKCNFQGEKLRRLGWDARPGPSRV